MYFTTTTLHDYITSAWRSSIDFVSDALQTYFPLPVLPSNPDLLFFQTPLSYNSHMCKPLWNLLIHYKKIYFFFFSHWLCARIHGFLLFSPLFSLLEPHNKDLRPNVIVSSVSTKRYLHFPSKVTLLTIYFFIIAQMSLSLTYSHFPDNLRFSTLIKWALWSSNEHTFLMKSLKESTCICCVRTFFYYVLF